MLPDDLDTKIRLAARQRGLSIAEVAREAIERHVGAPTPTGHLAFFAIGDGGPADASERADEFVGRAVARRHRATRSD
ncbi:MAG: CopG family transcriptional regulator [Candidatus Dormibacteria bacterium]